MTRVLVTGGSGFIGQPTLLALARTGADVHALSTRAAPPEIPGVRWWRVDLANASDVDAATKEIAAESLLHLAWYVEHGRFWEAPENVEWVERSLRLLRLFTAAGGRRVVMLGTSAEYDWSIPAQRLAELSQLGPATLYGTAKDGLRRVAAAFAEREGVEFAWARIFLLYGPREPPNRLVAALARATNSREPVEVSSGNQVRDLLHVEDVAHALVALVDSQVCGPVNVASGVPIPLAEVFDEIGSLSGRPDLICRGALPDRPSEPARLVADVSRLRDEVGFSPRWSLADGLADTLSWWQRRG